MASQQRTGTKAKAPAAKQAPAAKKLPAAKKAPAVKKEATEGTDQQSSTNSAVANNNTPPPAENPPTASEPTEVLVVRTRRGVASFRRAGLRFSREPFSIERAALSDDQIEALMNEPKLEVEEGTAELGHAQDGSE